METSTVTFGGRILRRYIWRRIRAYDSATAVTVTHRPPYVDSLTGGGTSSWFPCDGSETVSRWWAVCDAGRENSSGRSGSLELCNEHSNAQLRYCNPEQDAVCRIQPVQVMCLIAWCEPLSYLRDFVISRAAELRTRCSLSVTVFADLRRHYTPLHATK